MKTENAVREKSYAFAVRVVKLSQFLVKAKKEVVLSRQLLRSGTSIGANVEEAMGGQTGKDFFAKLNIAYKEARESHYWLRLLHDTGYLTDSQAESILADTEELQKLLGSILKTLRTKASPP